MSDDTFIRQRFDARAAHYDNPLTAFIGEQELRVVRAFIPPGRQVLDYGCGTGRTTLDLLRRRCVVTAYDLSPAMLAVAVARIHQSGFSAECTSRAERLAHRDWPYIACIGVLDYYPDPTLLLRTLKGYLAPGGTLVVTVPNAASPLAWVYAAASRLTVRAWPQPARRLAQACRAAGLAVRAERYAFPALRPLGLTLVCALAHTE